MTAETMKPIVRLFEDSCVCCGGRDAIEWPNMTVRRLASYLALNQGEKFSRREVSDALWAEGRYRSNSLSVALYQLKHTLGEGGIEPGQVFRSDRSTMGIESDEVVVDWLQFISHVLAAQDENSPKSALAALNTVTGPLLNEISDDWALVAKAEFDEKVSWCLSFVAESLPEDELTAETEEMARVISLCSHPASCGDKLAEKLASRSEASAKRFCAAVQRLGIELNHSTPIVSPGSAGQHLGVLVLVEGASSVVLDGVDKGLDPGMDLPENAAAFLDPSAALTAAKRMAEAHPLIKVLISVELFDSPTEVPPGAWAVMKQMRGPGVHIDGSTPLKRQPLPLGRRQARGMKIGASTKLN